MMTNEEENKKDLYEIAKAVAGFGSDGYIYNDVNDAMECPFCDASYGFGGPIILNRHHKPDCIYLKAQRLANKEEK